jgi:excisionase family DNA binding protein
MTEDKFISTQEIAALFGGSVRTVKAWAVKGRIPVHTTQGGHNRFFTSKIAPVYRKFKNGEVQ